MELVAMHGDVDLSTADRLVQPLNDAVFGGEGPVVLDLSDVEFMDSTGLHLLLNALRRLRRQRRALVLACPRGGVLRAIRAARLEDTFRIRDSVEEALEDAERSAGGH